MADVEDILQASEDMTTQELLRYLMTDKFPKKTIATCSLKGRSVALLKMVSEIDPSTPIVFCHSPNLYPESLEYRADLISKLGLTDIREPAENEGGPLSGDRNHSESVWAENPVDHSIAYKTIHLNQSLADFDCWISGVYHGIYPAEPGPRVKREGRLIRIDPFAAWTRVQVFQFLEDNGLHYHPKATQHCPEPVPKEAEAEASYHF